MTNVDFIDPIEAALQQLATHYTTAVANLVAPVDIEKYVIAHPEHGLQWQASEDELALTFLPDEVRYSYSAPRQVSDVDGSVYFRYGFLRATIFMDIWSRYKAPLAVAAALIETASHNDMPFSTGLNLRAANYHNQQFSVGIQTANPAYNNNTAMRGVFNTQWNVTLDMHLVSEHDKTPLNEVRVQMTTTLGKYVSTKVISIT